MISKSSEVRELVGYKSVEEFKKELEDGGEFVGLKEAKVLAGVAYSNYMRRLVTGGKVRGVKVFDSVLRSEKWYVSVGGIEDYVNGKRSRKGGRKFVLRMSVEDEGKVRKILEEEGIKFSLELAYKKD